MKIYRNAFKQLIQQGLAGILLLTSTSGWAGQVEKGIIEQSIKAYGGAKLLELESLTYRDTIKHFFAMQSGHQLQGAMTSHLSQYQIESKIDFVNQQAELKQLAERLVGNHGKANVTSVHRMFTKGQGYSIDQCSQEFKKINSVEFDNVDLGFNQLLDTLVIKHLAENAEHAKLIETANIQGQQHHVLTINPTHKQERILYLNAETGLLTRMVKKQDDQLRHYDFLNHIDNQGLKWAQQVYVSTGQQPLFLVTSREVLVNQPTPIKLSTALKKKPEQKAVDVANMTIEKLADGVYFVGQGWGYSLFIDLGEHYISVGAWHYEDHGEPYQNSLALLHQTIGQKKPVIQHIVTHHHTDHMAGLPSIVKSGTKLIVHAPDVNAVKAHLRQSSMQELNTNQFIPITLNENSTTYLANNKIMLFDLPTSHASHNLIVYLPEHNILFSEDIFGSSYQDSFDSPNSWPALDTYARLKKLNQKLHELGLSVEQYVSSHHKRILAQSEIEHALTLSCPNKGQLKKLLFSSDI